MMRILFLTIFFFGVTFAQTPSNISKKVEKLLKENKYNQAEQILLQHKDKPRALYYLSIVQLVKGKLDEAVDYAKDGLEKSKDKAKFYELLGDIYAVKAQKSGMLSLIFTVPKIKKNWKKAIAINPEKLSVRQKLFSFYLMAPGFAGGDADKAFEQAQEVLKINPAFGQIMLGQYYQHEKQNEKARQAFETAANLAPDSVNVLKEVGYFYLRNKNFPKAHAQFEHIARLKPTDPFAYDNLSDYYLKKGVKDSAFAMLKKATSLDSPNINIQFKMARVLADMGRFKEAHRMAQKLLQREMFFALRDQIKNFLKKIDKKLKND